MKRVFYYVLLIPALIGMISCTSSKTNVKDLNGKWNIVEVKGTKVTKEKMPFMEFNMADNKVHGNAGCNMFNTSLTPDSKDVSAFTLKPAAATMMACPDMEVEGVILTSIESVAGVKAGKSANEMILVDKDGKTLFVLSKV